MSKSPIWVRHLCGMKGRGFLASRDALVRVLLTWMSFSLVIFVLDDCDAASSPLWTWFAGSQHTCKVSHSQSRTMLVCSASVRLEWRHLTSYDISRRTMFFLTVQPFVILIQRLLDDVDHKRPCVRTMEHGKRFGQPRSPSEHFWPSHRPVHCSTNRQRLRR